MSEDELFTNIGASGHRMTDLEKAFMRLALNKSARKVQDSSGVLRFCFRFPL